MKIELNSVSAAPHQPILHLDLDCLHKLWLPSCDSCQTHVIANNIQSIQNHNHCKIRKKVNRCQNKHDKYLLGSSASSKVCLQNVYESYKRGLLLNLPS